MNQIKHKKYQNTGILFELLVRVVTSDTLSGRESKALSILKEFFTKTELGKEYKLYEIIGKNSKVSEGKAEILINTVIESSKDLNRAALRRQKYNLIKKIKENYDLDTFFRTKLPNYKAYASLYTLLEIYNSPNISNPKQVISNKINILEHLTLSKVNEEEVKENIYEEFKGYDKDLRILTYRIMLEKFNGKYDSLNEDQKSILKEFINSVDNTPKLREFYNDKVTKIKNNIVSLSKGIKDKPAQIKLNEVLTLLTPLDKNYKINNDDLVNLLQYCELVEELKITK